MKLTMRIAHSSKQSILTHQFLGIVVLTPLWTNETSHICVCAVSLGNWHRFSFYMEYGDGGSFCIESVRVHRCCMYGLHILLKNMTWLLIFHVIRVPYSHLLHNSYISSYCTKLAFVLLRILSIYCSHHQGEIIL
jgi:hypothetical protein